MKSLPPTLREKKRYVAFKVECDEPVSKEEIIRAVWNRALSLLGEVSAGSLGLRVLDYDNGTREGFLVCRNKDSWKIIGTLVFIGEINGKKVHVYTKGVSGTIKALKRKFLNKGPPIIEGKRDDSLMNLKIVRSYGDCIDALPKDRELLLRLKDMKMRYVGLMKNDLRTKDNLGGKEDATST
ncbi:MAG: Rpp14/Pop5 family protein [Candidatus Hydrothermarchaeaceae archaeon]